MKTSQEAKELGLYSSDCCNEELIFDEGDTFSRCPRCQGLCTWDLIETVVAIDEDEDVFVQAA